MDRNKLTFGIMNLMVIGLLAVLLLNLVTIQLAYPNHRLKTTERKPVFRWIGMQSDFTLLVDDDPKFASPMKADVSSNAHAFTSELEFGTYYWKVESGPFSSGVGRFTVVSSVMVSRNESALTNKGNTELLVHAPGITGAFLLGMDESMEIGEDANVMAEQA